MCAFGPMRTAYDLTCKRCCLLYLRALVRQGAPETAQGSLFRVLEAHHGPEHAQAVQDAWQQLGPRPKPRLSSTCEPTA